MAKTTIHIKPDVMRLINIRKGKMGEKATISGALMELARDGGRLMVLDELLETSEILTDKVEEIKEKETEYIGKMEERFKELQKDVLHLLCIGRRFAHSNNKELLEVADSDARNLLSKINKGI